MPQQRNAHDLIALQRVVLHIVLLVSWLWLLPLPILGVRVAEGQACTHYASPTGSGSTCTQESPCLINSFWSIPSLPGKVLCLNNGTYTGGTSMITPPQGIAGTSGSPITIRALNDGQVTLNGQNVRTPVFLSWWSGSGENAWFVIDGINVTNYLIGGFRSGGSDNILRRVIGYNGTTGDQNSFPFDIYGDRNRVEDCAGWGMNSRKIFNMSQGNDVLGAGYRRCWGEWNDHTQGTSTPTNTMQVGYNTTNALWENMMVTWDSLGNNSNADGVITFFNNVAASPPPGPSTITYVYGSLAYIRPGASFFPSQLVNGTYFSYATVVDLAMVIPSGYATKYPFRMLASGGYATNNTCTNCLAVHNGTAGVNESLSGWTFSGLRQGNGLAAATGGTSAFTLLPGLCYRYENGTLTSTPLWPWPMDARISAARVAGGFTDVVVTTAVETALGTIPAACRSDVDTTDPTVAITAPENAATVSGSTVAVTADASDNVGVVGVQFKVNGTNQGAEDTAAPYAITWDTFFLTDGNYTITALARDAATNDALSAAITVTVQNNPTDGAITANSVVTFIGNPTGGSITAVPDVAMVGNPTGGSITAATVPVFLGNPTGGNITATSVPVFVGNPTGGSISIP